MSLRRVTLDDMNPTQFSDHEVGGLMELRVRQHRDLSDPDSSVVENWQAIGVLVTTTVDGDIQEEESVVEVHLVRCPLGTPGLWELLDGISGDLAAVCSGVLDFDTCDPTDAVAELGGIGSHFLILNSVVCDKRFSGRQIGRWVAAGWPLKPSRP